MKTRIIDYMFYYASSPGKLIGVADKITGVTGCYKMPLRSDLPDTGYPSVNHPSDHLALGYQFAMTK